MLIIVGCRENILHDLSESEANRTFVVLAKAGVSAKRVKEGSNWTISVSSADVARALGVLDQGRLLIAPRRTIKKNSKSLLQSSEERQYYIQRNIEVELEETLERMPGVLEARVHLNLKPLKSVEVIQKDKTQSASVLIVTNDSEKIEKQRISQLIAGAAAMKSNEVTVILTEQDKPSEKSPVSITNKKIEPKYTKSILAGLLEQNKTTVVRIAIFAFVLLVAIATIIKQRRYKLLNRLKKRSSINEQMTGPTKLDPRSQLNGHASTEYVNGKEFNTNAYQG